MTENEARSKIPTELKRQILVEAAGHRCAIPTCRHPTIEVAHIGIVTENRRNFCQL